MKKTYLSANDYQRDVWCLAAAIRKSEWKPDYLIGLWRGGAPVAIGVHEFLKATGWKIEHLPLKCFSYTGIGEQGDRVEFFAGDAVFSLLKPGDKVLFIDDVFDTGRTAKAVMEKTAKTGADARFAAVYWKKEKNLTALAPDYLARELGGEWLVFPHEIEGLTPEEIREKNEYLADLMK